MQGVTKMIDSTCDTILRLSTKLGDPDNLGEVETEQGLMTVWEFPDDSIVLEDEVHDAIQAGVTRDSDILIEYC